MNFKFDHTEGFRIRDTEAGVEIVRPVMVTDITVAPGASDPSVLLSILKDPICPPKLDPYPDVDYAWCLLRERHLRSYNRANNAGMMDLVYRGNIITYAGAVPEIEYVLEDSNQSRSIQKWGTASGVQALKVWYLKGADGTTVIPPAGRTEKGGSVTKFEFFRIVRASGRATLGQWEYYKEALQDATGTINETSWGGYDRGVWLFMGPASRRLAGGNMVDVSLDFLEAKHGHFPILAYLDEHGEHPSDCSTEAQVMASVPVFNTIDTYNGLTRASVYYESEFNTLFNFVPD